MKILSTTGLTKLIQLIKSSFISVDDVVETETIETVDAETIELANVATSGDYNDLINKPTNVSDFTNDAGYITGISSSDVTGALGYTPYNSTNPNNYISRSGISATSPIAYNASTGVIGVSADYQIPTTTQITTFTNKQDALVSGTNIKTINGTSVLGSGNITISGSSSSLSTLTDVSLSSPANGQFLSYNGSKWANTSLQTTLSSSSTDNQVPSAKCVYDLVGNVEALINAL